MEHEWGHTIGSRYKVSSQVPHVMWQGFDGKWYAATTEIAKVQEILRLATAEKMADTRIAELEAENEALREAAAALLSAVGYRDGEARINWNDLPRAARNLGALLKEE